MTPAEAILIEIDDPLIAAIGQAADEAGLRAYIVGGYVRDKILGKDVKDIDIVVLGDGIMFAKLIAGKMNLKTVVTYENFGTAMLPIGERRIEFVGAREESYQRDSRKPAVRQASLESDLSRRDFTVNSLAASLNAGDLGTVTDIFDGLADLKNKILRTPLQPEKTFDDDPLRMMRAVRFAAQLGFTIEPATYQAMTTMAPRISIISVERITDEFFKTLASPRPSHGLKLMQDAGLTEKIFPELTAMVGIDQRKDYHHKDVFLHTLKVVDGISNSSEDVWLRFVGLVHDIAKPRTKMFVEGTGWTFHGHEEIGARMMKSIFRRMRLPMDKLTYVEKLVRLHLRPMALVKEGVTDSAIRRVMFDAGPDIDDLMLLCRADITSGNPQRVSRYLKNYDLVISKMKEVEEKDKIRNWQPPVKGDEIMAVCGIKPGPLVGVLKSKIEDAIIEGELANDHDAALSYLLSVKDAIIRDFS